MFSSHVKMAAAARMITLFLLLLGTAGCCNTQEWKMIAVEELRVEVEQKTHPMDRWGYVGTADGTHYFIKQGHAYLFPDRYSCEQRQFRIDEKLFPLGGTYPFPGRYIDAKIRWIFTRWNSTGDGFIFSLSYLDDLASPPSSQRPLTGGAATTQPGTKGP